MELFLDAARCAPALFKADPDGQVDEGRARKCQKMQCLRLKFLSRNNKGQLIR